MNFSTAFGKFPRAFFFFFWPNSDFCPVGIEGRKSEILSFKTARTVKGVLERKKFQNFLAKQPVFLQWVLERKMLLKMRTTSPVSVKERSREENFKFFRSKPAKPSSG